MKIDGPLGARGATGARRSEKAAGGKPGEFSRLIDGEDTEVAAPQSTRPVTRVDALLAVQEVGGEREGRRRARKRGERILDRLDEIRLGLLEGTIRGETLEDLAAAIREEKAAVSDPKLLDVLEEIDLRAQVELAKLEMAKRG